MIAEYDIASVVTEIDALRDRVALLERAVACFLARDMQHRGWLVDEQVKLAIAGSPCRLSFVVVNGVIDLSIEVTE